MQAKGFAHIASATSEKHNKSSDCHREPRSGVAIAIGKER